ncbi:hypothetical protein V1498_16040 [Peribacillus sp. SCS-26]
MERKPGQEQEQTQWGGGAEYCAGRNAGQINGVHTWLQEAL